MPAQLSTELADLCGQFEIYPVQIYAADVSGLTLWGGNYGGESDLFLIESGKISLYSGLAELADEAAGGAGGMATFRDTQELQVFLEGFTRLAALSGQQEVDVIDFVDSFYSIQAAPPLSPHNRGALLDCINAATDLAKQLEDDEMKARLTDENATLTHLYQFLYDEANEPFWPAVQGEFMLMFQWFSTKARFHG
jgi:hypothetical protein